MTLESRLKYLWSSGCFPKELAKIPHAPQGGDICFSTFVHRLSFWCTYFFIACTCIHVDPSAPWTVQDSRRFTSSVSVLPGCLCQCQRQTHPLWRLKSQKRRKNPRPFRWHGWLSIYPNDLSVRLETRRPQMICALAPFHWSQDVSWFWPTTSSQKTKVCPVLPGRVLTFELVDTGLTSNM